MLLICFYLLLRLLLKLLFIFCFFFFFFFCFCFFCFPVIFLQLLPPLVPHLVLQFIFSSSVFFFLFLFFLFFIFLVILLVIVIFLFLFIFSYGSPPCFLFFFLFFLFFFFFSFSSPVFLLLFIYSFYFSLLCSLFFLFLLVIFFFVLFFFFFFSLFLCFFFSKFLCSCFCCFFLDGPPHPKSKRNRRPEYPPQKGAEKPSAPPCYTIGSVLEGDWLRLVDDCQQQHSFISHSSRSLLHLAANKKVNFVFQQKSSPVPMMRAAGMKMFALPNIRTFFAAENMPVQSESKESETRTSTISVDYTHNQTWMIHRRSASRSMVRGRQPTCWVRRRILWAFPDSNSPLDKCLAAVWRWCTLSSACLTSHHTSLSYGYVTLFGLCCSWSRRNRTTKEANWQQPKIYARLSVEAHLWGGPFISFHPLYFGHLSKCSPSEDINKPQKWPVHPCFSSSSRDQRLQSWWLRAGDCSLHGPFFLNLRTTCMMPEGPSQEIDKLEIIVYCNLGFPHRLHIAKSPWRLRFSDSRLMFWSSFPHGNGMGGF